MEAPQVSSFRAPEVYYRDPPPAHKFFPLPFLHQNFNLSKNGLWNAIWCPKCSKVTPKASKMEPWAVILITFFFCKKRFYIRLHILCVGLQKQAVTLSLFLIFRRKCLKKGGQMAGGKGPKNALFLLFYSLVSLWVPLASFSLNFGLPGHHFGTFLGALGFILAPLCAPKLMARECKIQ